MYRPAIFGYCQRRTFCVTPNIEFGFFDDIAAWAAQDEPGLLKAQECAFDYDIRSLAPIHEQVRKVVAEETEVDTAPSWWRRRRKQKLEAPAFWGPFLFGVVIFVFLIIIFLTPIFMGVAE